MFSLLFNINIQVFLVFLAVFLFIYRHLTKPGHLSLPPGPMPLPIIGNLLTLGSDPREPLQKLRDKYGVIFTVYLGSRRTVMLSSYDVIKEAFVKCSHAFSGRPQDLFFVEEITKGLGKTFNIKQNVCILPMASTVFCV